MKLNKIISSIVSVGLALTGFSYVPATASSSLSDPIAEVFHDQGDIYISDMEPAVTEKVTIRIRTKKGKVTRAHLQYQMR